MSIIHDSSIDSSGRFLVDYPALGTLKIKKMHPNAIIPTRNLPSDAGLDLYSLHDVFLPLGTTNKVSTGIAIDVPEGYYAQINDRSSMAVKGLRVGAGVVDAGYHGELVVVLHNLTHVGTDDGYYIKAGDRIAQIVLHRIELPQVEEVTSFEETDRGNKGMGSSGR